MTADTDLKDPVCGMTVSADAKITYTYKDKVYRFCCAGCREKFSSNPEAYLAPLEASSAQDSGHDHVHQQASTAMTGVYTCPMDPEIRQDRPGSCPKCGMSLEPALPSAPGAVKYTCPMHPEIVRDEPGSCPICGLPRRT